jgi:poly(hydroxyalkanoate) granule-associated protein
MTMSKKAKEKRDRLNDEIRESAHKIWLAGLGAMTAAEEEGSKLFKSLVEKGKTYESKGREVVDDLRSDVEEAVGKARGKAENAWDRFEERSDDLIASAIKRFGVPTREEIATLTKRVEELTKVVEKLNAGTKAEAKATKPAKPTKTTKAAATTATTH